MSWMSSKYNKYAARVGIKTYVSPFTAANTPTGNARDKKSAAKKSKKGAALSLLAISVECADDLALEP